MHLTKSQYLYFSINTDTAFCCCFEFSLLSRGRFDLERYGFWTFWLRVVLTDVVLAFIPSPKIPNTLIEHSRHVSVHRYLTRVIRNNVSKTNL